MVGAASDIAGEVVEVGTGVTKFKAGDKVVSYLGFPVSVIYTMLCLFTVG